VGRLRSLPTTTPTDTDLISLMNTDLDAAVAVDRFGNA
jgi:hypothetical protein